MADGCLNFDTNINSEGFEKGLKSLSDMVGDIKPKLKSLAMALTAAFSVKKLVDFGRQSIETASDLAEVQNVVDTAFGESKQKMEDFADTAVKTYGISKLTAKQIIDEVNRCSDKIEAVTGVRPTLFRCPYGEYDDNVIGTVNGMGLTAVQWDTDSLDWKKLTAGEIYKRVSSKVQPGSIVLFHNAGLHTPEALPSIIEYLLAEGYTIVPISEILLTGDTYIDHTGRQHAASA